MLPPLDNHPSCHLTSACGGNIETTGRTPAVTVPCVIVTQSSEKTVCDGASLQQVDWWLGVFRGQHTGWLAGVCILGLGKYTL